MRKLIALVALSLAVACSDSTNPNTDDITGTYTLQTVDNNRLPVTFTNAGTSITILTDVITVANNGTWSETYNYRQTVNGQPTTGTGADAGTWSRGGSNVSFYVTNTNGSSTLLYSGSYASNALTLDDGSDVYVFTR